MPYNYQVRLAILAIAGTCTGCTERMAPPGYTLVGQYRHDTGAYAQGLLLHDGVLFESTGIYGRSQLRRVDPATGEVLTSVSLPSDRFGEGLARFGDRLYQLTWHHGTAYAFDLTTLALVDSFQYAGEGWGLTSDGQSLIMTSGTATVSFLDPATFAVRRQISVRDGDSPRSGLNELERRTELIS